MKQTDGAYLTVKDRTRSRVSTQVLRCLLHTSILASSHMISYTHPTFPFCYNTSSRSLFIAEAKPTQYAQQKRNSILPLLVQQTFSSDQENAASVRHCTRWSAIEKQSNENYLTDTFIRQNTTAVWKDLTRFSTLGFPAVLTPLFTP